MSNKQDELQPVIIKRIKKVDGHHGGAWKVAYADFVTAMMAFFLMLWLLSVTTEVQKDGIADYFKPTPRISNSESGSSGVMGGTTVAIDGALTKQVDPYVERQKEEPPVLTTTVDGKISDSQYEEETKKREAENFKHAEEALRKAIESTPELKEMTSALKIDMTPEGLRIQIIDEEGRPLFPSGSAELLPHTRKLLRKVSEIIQRLPNEVSVRGHTDSVPYGQGATYTNWELSADRANASRRALLDGGLPTVRVNNVVGKADTDHLFTDNPRDGRNRRISVILLHEHLTTKEGTHKSSRAVKKQQEVKKKLYQRSEGKVVFP